MKVFDKQFISSRELVARLDVSMPTLRQWERDGAIPKPFRIGGGRTLRWKLNDVEQWEAERSITLA